MKIDEKLLEKLRPLGKEVSFQMGEVLVRENEEADKVYVILSGHVSITKKNPGGEDLFIGVVSNGAVVGEMGVFLGEERGATARASSNVKALEFTKENFLEAVSREQELALTMLREFSKRVSNLNRRLVNTITSKIMYVLGVYILEKLVMDESPYYQPEEGTADLSIKQVSMEYGFEKEKIASAIKSFEKAGVVQVVSVNVEEEGGERSEVYKLRLNPQKLKAYLRSIAYV